MSSAVLQARELRWQTRLSLAAEGPLLSATLRAPARLRLRPEYLACFRALCRRMERRVEGLRLALDAVDADGPARHYHVSDAKAAKAAAIAFEEEEPGAALLDVDVMEAGGRALSRAELGLPARACAVCGARPAAACVRGKAHDDKATLAAFEALRQAVPLPEALARRIGSLALRALLYEVSISPKPGLVDRFDRGAHSDMDFYTFLDSAAALQGCFFDCARLGAESEAPEGSLLEALRPLGIAAEERMMKATGGVNTHRGLIFSLGILCAAAGRLGGAGKACEVCALAARIAAPALDDGPGEKPSHGELVRRRHGDLGVRGEAAAGFPAALHVALPALRAGAARGLDRDQAGLRALLHLMAQVRDTNVLHRGGEAGLRFMREGAAALLAQDAPRQALLDFGRQMTSRGLSPGGCADLLCVALFLQALEEGD